MLLYAMWRDYTITLSPFHPFLNGRPFLYCSRRRGRTEREEEIFRLMARDKAAIASSKSTLRLAELSGSFTIFTKAPSSTGTVSVYLWRQREFDDHDFRCEIHFFFCKSCVLACSKLWYKNMVLYYKRDRKLL